MTHTHNILKSDSRVLYFGEKTVSLRLVMREKACHEILGKCFHVLQVLTTHLISLPLPKSVWLWSDSESFFPSVFSFVKWIMIPTLFTVRNSYSDGSWGYYNYFFFCKHFSKLFLLLKSISLFSWWRSCILWKGKCLRKCDHLVWILISISKCSQTSSFLWDTQPSLWPFSFCGGLTFWNIA